MKTVWVALVLAVTLASAGEAQTHGESGGCCWFYPGSLGCSPGVHNEEPPNGGCGNEYGSIYVGAQGFCVERSHPAWSQDAECDHDSCHVWGSFQCPQPGGGWKSRSFDLNCVGSVTPIIKSESDHASCINGNLLTIVMCGADGNVRTVNHIVN